MLRGNLWILILVVASLTACSSSKKAVSTNKKKEEKLKKEQVILSQTDKIFNDFKDEKGKNLNQFTLAYIDEYNEIAVRKMMEYGIPASITLAQGILESGNGLSELTRKANNHFGIKCHKDWKGKKVYHDDDRRNECFRKYSDPEGSFNDHSLFLTSRSRYASLFDLPPDNYNAWAKGLKKAGYATDRKYPNKLISFIENFQLHEYDAMVLDQKGYKKELSKKQYTESKSRSKYIVVNRGDTLYSIARRNNISVTELKKYNSLHSNDISIGQKLYVEKL